MNDTCTWKKGVLLAAGIIVFVFLVSGVWFLRACGILPYTQTKYFYYIGWLDKKTGISFTVNDEDYKKIKEGYLSPYKTKEDDYQKSN